MCYMSSPSLFIVLFSHFFGGLNGGDLEVLWIVWGGIVNVVINGRLELVCVPGTDDADCTWFIQV